jgi:hypothetical protein
VFRSRWLIIIPAILFALFAKPAKAVEVPPNPYYNPPQNLTVESAPNDGITVKWYPPEVSNYDRIDIYVIEFYRLTDGVESGGWAVWTDSENHAYTFGSWIFDYTGNNLRFKIKAGSDACVGRPDPVGYCLYGTKASVDADATNLPELAPEETTTTWASTTSSTTTTTTSTTTVPSTTVPVTNPTTTTVQETTTSTSTSTTTVPQTTTSVANSTSTSSSNPPTTTTQAPTTTTTSTTIPEPTTTSTSTTSVPQTTTTTSSVPQTTSTVSTTTTTEPPPVPTPVTQPQIVEPEPDETVVPDEPEEVPTGTTSTTIEEATPEETLPEETTTTTEPSPEPYPDTTEEPVVDTTLPEATDTPLEAPLSDEEVENILVEAETTEALVEALAELSSEQVEQVMEALLADEPTEEQATALASSPEVLAVISTEQAAEIFEALDVAELSDAQTEELIAAIESAPTEIREEFEDTINIFGEGLDDYTPTGSNIPVGERRTLIAVTAGITLAAAGTRIRR